MTPEFREFFAEFRRECPPEARVLFCQFRGDPNDDAGPERWRARVLNNPDAVDERANLYLCVSAMGRNARGEFRRRKENFAGGLALMIDDLGDGPGAKHPLALLGAAQPNALIETSPGNFQAVFLLREAERSLPRFDALIRGFIERQFLGAADPGMAGVNRVFRPPVGLNGKAKYGGAWPVRLAAWAPERRLSTEELAEAFGVPLVVARPPRRDPGILLGAKPDRIRAFVAARAALRSAGMLKRQEPNLAGWQDVRCPWTDQHTGGADNGAAICEPNAENEWFGGFACHHGHCAEKGWRELTEWLAEEAEWVLAETNRCAPERIFWKTAHTQKGEAA